MGRHESAIGKARVFTVAIGDFKVAAARFRFDRGANGEFLASGANGGVAGGAVIIC